MRHKKSELSLEFIFLILLGVTAVLVIIGLITSWATKARSGVESLGREEQKDADILEIDLTSYSCTRQLEEITKDVRICKEKGSVGQLPNSGGCYVLYTSCGFTGQGIAQSIVNSGINAGEFDVIYNGDSKIYISYSFSGNVVKIK